MLPECLSSALGTTFKNRIIEPQLGKSCPEDDRTTFSSAKTWFAPSPQETWICTVVVLTFLTFFKQNADFFPSVSPRTIVTAKVFLRSTCFGSQHGRNPQLARNKFLSAFYGERCSFLKNTYRIGLVLLDFVGDVPVVDVFVSGDQVTDDGGANRKHLQRRAESWMVFNFLGQITSLWFLSGFFLQCLGRGFLSIEFVSCPEPGFFQNRNTCGEIAMTFWQLGP